MKICCVVASLGTGGAERVMASLGNHWVEAGHQVSVITLASEADDTYPLDSRVERTALGVMGESLSLPQAVVMNTARVRALRRGIKSFQPDVVITFNAQVNVLALLACVGLGVRVVVSERAHPPADSVGTQWSVLRWLTYRLAHALVVQSERSRPWAQRVGGPNRVYVIPNAVSSAFGGSEVTLNHRLPMVLGVGRLVPQKGFDVLIRAFASVARRHPNWSLTIVGQGPEEGALKVLAAEVAAPGAVTFPGAVIDPKRYYRSAGFFVLSSRFEGFPNVLLEAMASGCAVIASDCPVGPSEIIRQGVDGVLVTPDDVESLVHAMDLLMGDATERERLGARARDVTHRFRPDRVMQLWDDLIARVRE